MAMHNPLRIGPQQAPPSEWDATIQRMRPRPYAHERHNQTVRLQRETQLNQPIVWQTPRAYLGTGSAILQPYMEAILPKNIAASKFMERIVGVTEGERVELLPATVQPGYQSQVAAPERVFVYRRSTAKEDFIIPASRVLRVILTRSKAIYL